MKKRSQLDSIEVGKPCSQDWNRMYGNDEVRFCEHCVKQVHDLSAMTRRAAEKFVARSQNKGDKICVRYVRRPDGKVQNLSDKLYQISGRASRLAAGVFGASLTLASAVYAQNDPAAKAPVRDAIVLADRQANEPKENPPRSICGTIFDANQAVVPNVMVTLTNEKNGEVQSVTSNENGAYVFAGVEKGEYTLRTASNFGFTPTENRIDLNAAEQTKYDVTLQAERMMGEMVVRISYENELVLAVQNRDLDRVTQLITQNVDVNKKDENEGVTALHLAVRNGSKGIVELLLNAGAKVNARDAERRTPLMMIAEAYYEEEFEDAQADVDENGPVESRGYESVRRAGPEAAIFRLLISHGARIELRDNEGMTALMHAAQSGKAEVVSLLLSHGAAINLQAKSGRTALMEAVETGNADTVRMLLDAGADVSAKDEEGDTAYSICSDSEIEQMLVAHGAVEPEPEPEPEPDAS
jgi:Ankyrin repeats (3 copies)/Carboxypeptidase regulatory-like domain